MNTTFRILDIIQELEGAVLADITRELDIHKSTVYLHLDVLKHNQLIIKENGEYYFGLQFLGFGGRARTNRIIYRKVKPKMRRLAKEAGK